jgi:hypothetical protein
MLEKDFVKLPNPQRKTDSYLFLGYRDDSRTVIMLNGIELDIIQSAVNSSQFESPSYWDLENLLTGNYFYASTHQLRKFLADAIQL